MGFIGDSGGIKYFLKKSSVFVRRLKCQTRNSIAKLLGIPNVGPRGPGMQKLDVESGTAAPAPGAIIKN